MQEVTPYALGQCSELGNSARATSWGKDRDRGDCRQSRPSGIRWPAAERSRVMPCCPPAEKHTFYMLHSTMGSEIITKLFFLRISTVTNYRNTHVKNSRCNAGCAVCLCVCCDVSCVVLCRVVLCRVLCCVVACVVVCVLCVVRVCCMFMLCVVAVSRVVC